MMIEKECAIAKVKELANEELYQELYNQGVMDAVKVIRNMETVENLIIKDGR